MAKTMRIKAESLLKNMALVMPDDKVQRVISVTAQRDGEEWLLPDELLVHVDESKTAPKRHIVIHAHSYIRISARVPAHVRGEVLARAGVTGEWMYATEHTDKPRRYRFTWTPTQSKRYGGYGDHSLTYGQLRNMSDFVLTGGVPQE